MEKSDDDDKKISIIKGQKDDDKDDGNQVHYISRSRSELAPRSH